MFHKKVTYISPDEEIQAYQENRQPNTTTKDLFFFYTPAALRRYKQLTGREFTDDYAKAFSKLMDMYSSVQTDEGVTDTDNVNMSDESTRKQYEQLFANVLDSELNDFLINAFASLYFDKTDKLTSAQTAIDSDWIASVANIGSLSDLIDEVNKGIGLDTSKKNQTPPMEAVKG